MYILIAGALALILVLFLLNIAQSKRQKELKDDMECLREMVHNLLLDNDKLRKWMNAPLSIPSIWYPYWYWPPLTLPDNTPTITWTDQQEPTVKK